MTLIYNLQAKFLNRNKIIRRGWKGRKKRKGLKEVKE